MRHTGFLKIRIYIYIMTSRRKGRSVFNTRAREQLYILLFSTSVSRSNLPHPPATATGAHVRRHTGMPSWREGALTEVEDIISKVNHAWRTGSSSGFRLSYQARQSGWLRVPDNFNGRYPIADRDFGVRNSIARGRCLEIWRNRQRRSTRP